MALFSLTAISSGLEGKMYYAEFQNNSRIAYIMNFASGGKIELVEVIKGHGGLIHRLTKCEGTAQIIDFDVEYVVTCEDERAFSLRANRRGRIEHFDFFSTWVSTPLFSGSAWFSLVDDESLIADWRIPLPCLKEKFGEDRRRCMKWWYPPS